MSVTDGAYVYQFPKCIKVKSIYKQLSKCLEELSECLECFNEPSITATSHLQEELYDLIGAAEGALRLLKADPKIYKNVLAKNYARGYYESEDKWEHSCKKTSSTAKQKDSE